MLSAREYVELMTINRLSDKGGRTVPSEEFQAMITKIDDLIESTSRRSDITGFTQEDIKSFFGMKVHQALRRGEYNCKRNPHSYFATVFSNMLHNLHRDMERSRKNLMSEDALDNAIFFGDIEKM